jgi:hypothetical protein
MPTELLTNSRMTAFKECRRKAFFAYEQGIRPTDDARALRMGSAGHAGAETLGRGGDINAACLAVNEHYRNRPPFIDEWEWEIERETILRLICAYEWRWRDHKLEYLAVELPFSLPLLNPQSGKSTPNFNLGGKIDGIVRMEDGRLAVKESKFLGEDIGPDAALWRRMKMDQQVSLYIIAARRLGFECDTVLYDVIRKPSIKPEGIPVRDELRVKIVLDAAGNRVRNKDQKTWRQTGDKELGYVLQTRQMTAEEWGDKLTDDICKRHDFYFSRVEIPRLSSDLEEFEYELWDMQLAVRDAQRNDRWYRTVNKNTCPYCPYFNFCASGFDSGGPLPESFERVYDVHPELGRSNDVVSNSPTACEAASA